MFFAHTHFIAGIEIEYRKAVNYLNHSNTSVFKEYFFCFSWIYYWKYKKESYVNMHVPSIVFLNIRILTFAFLFLSIGILCNCFPPCWKVLCSYSLICHSMCSLPRLCKGQRFSKAFSDLTHWKLGCHPLLHLLLPQLYFYL